MDTNFEYKGRKYFIYESGNFCFLFDITDDDYWQLTQWWFSENLVEEDIEIAKGYIDKPVGSQKIIDSVKKFRKVWYENVNKDSEFHKVENAEEELMNVILNEDIVI